MRQQLANDWPMLALDVDVIPSGGGENAKMTSTLRKPPRALLCVLYPLGVKMTGQANTIRDQVLACDGRWTFFSEEKGDLHV